MSEHRLYKKYPNRRLYGPLERPVDNPNGDTVDIRIKNNYVTFRDIGKFIARGGTVTIEDHATNDDLTLLTLRQVLMEGPKANFTDEQLHAMIRMAFAS